MVSMLYKYIDSMNVLCNTQAVQYAIYLLLISGMFEMVRAYTCLDAVPQNHCNAEAKDQSHTYLLWVILACKLSPRLFQYPLRRV